MTFSGLGLPFAMRSRSQTRIIGLIGLALNLLFATVAAYKQLSDDALRFVPSGGLDLDVNNGALLAPILIPRVPGTPGQLKVQEHFVNFFRTQLPAWEIIWQNSTSRTPVTGSKNVPFANLIFRREPPWTQPGQTSLLTLVAHYDSKYTPEGFIGATDSAAPCAILMHVARTIDEFLTQLHNQSMALKTSDTQGQGIDMGVQILLLDGEEAFYSWTDTDSLYGARSLAETWEKTAYVARSDFANPLNQIPLFVLLDLLGSDSPKVPSYFQTTHWAYKNMATIESRMRDLRLLESQPAAPFLPDMNKMATQFGKGFIEDDHIPFMSRGVPILHIIASPFPKVWHTLDDDGAHLDMPTVRDWARIVTAFAMEWLEIAGVEPTA